MYFMTGKIDQNQRSEDIRKANEIALKREELLQA